MSACGDCEILVITGKTLTFGSKPKKPEKKTRSVVDYLIITKCNN